MPAVDPPSRPRNAIVFILTRFPFLQGAGPAFFGFTRSGQTNQHIARNTERRHLTRKDLVETIVIPGGGENPAIAGETNRGKRASILGKANHKFCRKMGCISRAAAVPAHQQFVPVRKH